MSGVARRRGRGQVRRALLRCLFGVALGVSLALAVMLLPVPGLSRTAEALRTPAAVTLLVCYLGKLLYDTLFYDRYLP